MYDIYTGSTEVDVSVDFDDSIAEDRQQNYNYYSTAVNDKLLPRIEAIQRIFKVTKKQAEDWIAEIDAEDNTLPAEMIDLLGVPARDMSNE